MFDYCIRKAQCLNVEPKSQFIFRSFRKRKEACLKKYIYINLSGLSVTAGDR